MSKGQSFYLPLLSGMCETDLRVISQSLYFSFLEFKVLVWYEGADVKMHHLKLKKKIDPLEPSCSSSPILIL